ncbi:proto-oncogene tyrosine-protein kinase ROS [Pelodytes ibericus]
MPLTFPMKAHSTRAMEVSLAERASASPEEICRAATWSSGNTFIRHYRLDVFSSSEAAFERKVLQVVGSSFPPLVYVDMSHRHAHGHFQQADSCTLVIINGMQPALSAAGKVTIDQYNPTAKITSYDFQCMNRDNDSYNETQDFTAEPTPPFASFIGPYNVTLVWNAANISGVAYIIQWKYVHITSDWEYTQIVTEPSYTVNNLQPYTEYWFRVIWIFCQLQFYSLSSPPYRTLAFGVPTGAPIIENLVSSSPESIEVSWHPPVFPNGPVIGYNLKLSTDDEDSRSYSVYGKQIFQFYATKPGITYRFSITAVNEEGEGPAAEANITTMKSPVVDKPSWLFLSRNDTFKKREKLNDILYESQCLTVQNRITGVSINIHTQKVYFTEQNHIWVKGAYNMTDTTDFRILYNGIGAITSISVDWLYNKMYFVMNNQVYSCDLMNCSSAEAIPLVTTLTLRKIVVDPYNGYLFLLLDDGIHRIILPETPIQDVFTNHIVNSSIILDIMVIFRSKRLVYASKIDRGNFQIVSIFLDGSSAQTLRQIKDQSIMDISSFAYYSESLMFTDGNIVFYEDYYNNNYWYNELLVACDLAAIPSSDYNNMILYGQSSQPFPYPGQPHEVLVLFGTQSAAIVWRPPKSTIESSSAAWQDWTYAINITAKDTKIPQSFSNIISTNITVTELTVGTAYEVTVQVLSPAGKSQWTTPLTGTTMYPAEEEPYFIAVGPNGTWKQPLDKFGPGELISGLLRHVSDLDWYNNTLFWSNETGHVHMWDMANTTLFSSIHITEIRRAGPLCFDWLGQSIYWSDKVNAKIYRKHIDTPALETVKSVNYLINDLAVDSLNAFLYWSTSYTVESSSLNGQKHLIIQNLTLFSSTQVVALTLEIKHGLLYWLVKDGLNINMYNTKLREHGSPDNRVTEFASWSYSQISQHALMFSSNRLFWINGQKYITVQEVSQSTCTPFSEPAEFTAFSLVLKSLKPLPGNFSYTPDVMPDMVPSSSFEVKGNYSLFLISWKEPLNVEFGTIFYCVESKILQHQLGMNNDQCLTPEDFSYPSFTVRGLEPYAEFDFSVTPYTYWSCGPTTSLLLRAPEGVPSPPLNPRIFLLHNYSAFNNEILGVEMRWDNPKMPNGVLTTFMINYRIDNETMLSNSTDVWTTANITVSTRFFHLIHVNPGLLLEFQVKAYTSAGAGPFSEMKKANLSDVRPAPAVIHFYSREVTLIDTYRKEALWRFSAERLKAISYITHDGKLYYILNDSIFSKDIEDLSTVLLLQDERLLASQFMTMDWIARQLYVSMYSEQNGPQLYTIDLEHKTKVLKAINISLLSRNSSLEALEFYALQSRLYWIESWDTGKRISYYSIPNGTLSHVLGHENNISGVKANCTCSIKSSDIGSSLALDTTNRDTPYIYFLCNATEIWTSDLEGCHCLKVITLPQLNGEFITSVTVDDYFIYWSIVEKENCTIYQTSKGDELPSILQMDGYQTKVMAYTPSLQPFPDKRCLVLTSITNQPTISTTTNTTITLRLPPAVTQASCPLIISTTPTYRVTYRKLDDNIFANCSSNNTACITLEFQDQIAIIEELDPYSNYEIEVTVGNYYSVLLAQQPLGTVVIAKTGYGVPGAVDTILITVLSDKLVNITWGEPSKPNGPLASIRYQITSNLLTPYPIFPRRKDEFQNGQLTWLFTTLLGGTKYQFKVLAFHPDENWFSESAPVHATTFKAPAIPEKIVPGNTSLVLQWRAPEEDITNFYFELKELKEEEWVLPLNTICKNGTLFTCTLTGVVPDTVYHVRTVVIFVTDAKSISEPTNFKTSAGVPGKPGTPQSLPSDKNTIRWDTSDDNGSNLTYNILEYRQTPADGRVDPGPWQVAYNGSCPNICLWKSTTLEGSFLFRVAAANILGIGNYSDISEIIILTKEKSTLSNEVSIIVGTLLGIVLVVLLTAGFVLYKRAKQSHHQNTESKVVIFEDKELEALRGVSNAVGLANACYAIRTLPTQTEMQTLPQFPREKLTLCVFLGSGAFGEVYEGNAEDILGPETGITKVAIKTLKSDATDHEKAEFLKEAHLMRQFEHPNILKLLGVCLFNEPQYIILELMDGRDLLTYLRGARANTSLQKPLLSTLDLIDISINICRGCEYLEKMHFVHRDLAARNCLVSVKEYNNPERIVKIGDFGLARDIYSYDYYRKKGEGLLPVRWMAPESLVDGLFTSRSDVWSFGILLWEVFSLGQQPYPGYSNLEVLHHVRSGQRMETPGNCSDDLWDLILKCWTQDPLKRPTFFYLKKQLEELKSCSVRSTRSKNRSVYLEGIFNPAFEDSDVNAVSTDAECIGSLTLSETKNDEGLNYLMVTT